MIIILCIVFTILVTSIFGLNKLLNKSSNVRHNNFMFTQNTNNAFSKQKNEVMSRHTQNYTPNPRLYDTAVPSDWMHFNNSNIVIKLYGTVQGFPHFDEIIIKGTPQEWDPKRLGYGTTKVNPEEKFFGAIEIYLKTPPEAESISYMEGWNVIFHLDGSYARLAPSLGQLGTSYRLGTNCLASSDGRPCPDIMPPQVKSINITEISENNNVEMVILSENNLYITTYKIKLIPVNAFNVKQEIEQYTVLRENYSGKNNSVSFGPASSSMYFLGKENTPYSQNKFASDAEHILIGNKNGTNLKPINNPWSSADYGSAVKERINMNPGMWNSAIKTNIYHNPTKWGLIKSDRNPYNFMLTTKYTQRPSIIYDNIVATTGDGTKSVNTYLLHQVAATWNEYQDNQVAGLIINEDLKSGDDILITYNMYVTINEEISSNDVQPGCCTNVSQARFTYDKNCPCTTVYPPMYNYQNETNTDYQGSFGISTGEGVNTLLLKNSTSQECSKFCADLGPLCQGFKYTINPDDKTKNSCWFFATKGDKKMSDQKNVDTYTKNCITKSDCNPPDKNNCVLIQNKKYGNCIRTDSPEPQ